jgi:hypothetical protein
MVEKKTKVIETKDPDLIVKYMEFLVDETTN